jgi:transposase-like protein
MDEPKKKKRMRRTFTEAFKAEAVRLCKVGDRTVHQVAEDLNLTETALRAWIRRSKVEASKASRGSLTSEERDELNRLREENKRLLMERDILKKATAFFAKENR